MPQFWTQLLPWCRFVSPKVDLLVGSAQGSGKWQLLQPSLRLPSSVRQLLQQQRRITHLRRLSQRVQVSIYQILRPRRAFHVGTLGPKYLTYEYLGLAKLLASSHNSASIEDLKRRTTSTPSPSHPDAPNTTHAVEGPRRSISVAWGSARVTA